MYCHFKSVIIFVIIIMYKYLLLEGNVNMKLSQLRKYEIYNLNGPITIKEIRFVI